MEDQPTPEAEALTADKVRQALIEKHGLPLSDDDPILMVATMFSMFQSEYDSTLKKHQAAIEKFMINSSKHYADKVQQSTDDLLNRAVQGTIRNNLEAMSEFKESMRDFTKTNRLYALLSLCSGVASICLFASWLFLRS